MTTGRPNLTGKSLIDAQKLKAAKQQQQMDLQQKQGMQTISQIANKPILIRVDKAQVPATTTDQMNASIVAGKSYKNKDDFISSEIPTELFQDDNSQVISLFNFFFILLIFFLMNFFYLLILKTNFRETLVEII